MRPSRYAYEKVWRGSLRSRGSILVVGAEALGGLRVEALVPEGLKDWHKEGIARYARTGHGPFIYSPEPLPASSHSYGLGEAEGEGEAEGDTEGDAEGDAVGEGEAGGDGEAVRSVFSGTLEGVGVVTVDSVRSVVCGGSYGPLNATDSVIPTSAAAIVITGVSATTSGTRANGRTRPSKTYHSSVATATSTAAASHHS